MAHYASVSEFQYTKYDFMHKYKNDNDVHPFIMLGSVGMLIFQENKV